MTLVSFRLDKLGVPGEVPARAQVTITPTAQLVNRPGDRTLIGQPLTVSLDDEGLVLDLPGSHREFAYEVIIAGDDYAHDVVVLVPEPIDDVPLEFGLLERVDPATLVPIDAVPPSVQELFGKAERMLESIIARSVSATVDSTDPDVVRLAVPAFMLDPIDDLIVALPVTEFNNG